MLNFFFLVSTSFFLPLMLSHASPRLETSVSHQKYHWVSILNSPVWGRVISGKQKRMRSHFCPDCTRQTESLCPILPAVSQEILQFISVLQVADVIVRILCGFVLSEFLNFKKCFPLFLFFQPFRQFYWFLFPCS